MDSSRTTRAARRGRDRGSLILLVGGLVFAALASAIGLWTVTAYFMVILFAFVAVVAVYFWSTLLFGGAWRWVRRGARTPVPWALGGDPDTIPEHDLDPGLELLAAGVLSYGNGDVDGDTVPQIAMRRVSLAGGGGLQPFIVARTGYARDCDFEFTLLDEAQTVHYRETVVRALSTSPRMVLPDVKWIFAQPGWAAQQSWMLQVRSGVTVVATVRFELVNGPVHDDAPLPEWYRRAFPQLFDRVSDDLWRRSVTRYVVELERN